MKLVKRRLKSLIALLLIISLLLSDQSLTMVVQAVIPDNFFQELNVGDTLNGDTEYNFIQIQDRFPSDERWTAVFTGVNEQHIEIINPGRNILRQSNITYLNGSTETTRVVIITSDIDSKDYVYRFVEDNGLYASYELFGSSDNCTLDYWRAYDGVDITENAAFDASGRPSDISEVMYRGGAFTNTLFDSGFVIYSGAYFHFETPTIERNSVYGGWYLASIEDGTRLIFNPAFPGDIKVNYYVKSYSVSDSYYLSHSEYTDPSLEYLTYTPHDLNDGVFIGWDKSAADVPVGATEIDLYAQYGLRTAITRQPQDVDVRIVDTAEFEVEAVGVDLTYDWMFAEKSTTSRPVSFTNVNNMTATDNSVMAANPGPCIYSFQSDIVASDGSKTLTFDYISSGYPFDVGYIHLYKDGAFYDGIDVSGSTGSGSKTFYLDEPGSYTLKGQYENTIGSTIGFQILNATINNTFEVVEDSLFSDEASASIDKSNVNFKDGAFVVCKVSGRYGTVYSDLAKLTVRNEGTELKSISAEYTGDIIKVNSDYSKDDLVVKANYYNYATDLIESQVITDYALNSQTVTAIGDNEFTATWNGLACDFIVKGGDVPSAPKNLKASAITTNSSTLNWEPAESNGADITHYNVYLPTQQNAIQVTELSHIYNNLDDDTGYTVQVSASNQFGEGAKASVTFNTLLDVYITGITAEYTGDSVLVGNDFNTSEVIVTVSWSDSSTSTLAYTDLTAIPGSCIVNMVGWDNMYELGYGAFTTTLKVHGYKFDRIEANYRGNDVPIKSNYSQADVEVVGYYTPDKNGTIKEELVTSFTVDSTFVSSVGANNFIATYNGFTDDFVVDGYKEALRIEATYKDESVLIGNEFDEDNVKIIVIYSDDSTEIIPYSELDIIPDSKVVTDLGWNNYNVGYRNMTTTLKVHGYGYDKITAEYIGSNVMIKTNYNKDDVHVALSYTDNLQGLTSTILSNSEWTESSLYIANVGANDFVATFLKDSSLTDGYSVIGLDSVSNLEATYTGGDVYVGDEYNRDDVIVYVHYESGTSVQVDDWTTDTTVVEKIGENNFTIYWGDFTTDFTVIGYSENGLSAVYSGPDIDVGSEYSKDNVSVKVNYSNNTSKVLTTGEWSENSLLVENAGENNFTATYKGLTAKYVVMGKAEIVATGITAVYTGGDVEVNTNYNKDDVVVTVTMSDGSQRNLSNNEWLESSLLVSAVGSNEFTAKYGKLTTGYSVTGINLAKSLTAQYTGEPVVVGNNYDKDNVVVEVAYSDGSKIVLDSTAWTESSLKVEKDGTNTFTATYNGLTDNYEVIGIISEPTIESIAAIYKGTDIRIGEEYKKPDVEVVVTYSDNSTRQLADNEWSESSLKVTDVGTNKFTATFRDLSTDYSVNGVLEMTKLTAEYKGSKVAVGEKYNKSDVDVIVTFHNESTKKLSDSDWEESSLYVIKTGENEYSASYGGMEAEYVVDGYEVSTTAEPTTETSTTEIPTTEMLTTETSTTEVPDTEDEEPAEEPEEEPEEELWEPGDDTNETIDDVPKTGDTTDILKVLMTFISSIIVFVWLSVKKEKN